MPAPSTRHIQTLLQSVSSGRGRRVSGYQSSRRAFVTRARRKHVIVLRGRSVTTPTPLVRNRVQVHDDARPGQWARLGRARRRHPNLLRNGPPPPPQRTVVGVWVHNDRRVQLAARRRHPTHALLVRAPSDPTPTPLVRNRVQVHDDVRPSQWAKLGRARRRHPNLLRSPMPKPPVRTVTGVWVHDTNRAHRWARYSRAQRRNHATIIRARSVPTPTPLVRDTTWVNDDLRPQRFARLGRIRRRKPNLLRSIILPKPLSTVAPAVTGNNWVGQTLTTTNGTWQYSPTSFAYQWYSDTLGDSVYLAIGGATASTYALTNAEIGDHVMCVVTATNASGSTNASSNATAIILAFPLRTVLTPLEPTALGLRRTGGVTGMSILVTGTNARVGLRMTNGGGGSATITLRDVNSSANDVVLTLPAGQTSYVALRHRPHFVQPQDGYLVDCSTSSVTFEAVAI